MAAMESGAAVEEMDPGPRICAGTWRRRAPSHHGGRDAILSAHERVAHRVIQCMPLLKDTEELMKDLDCTNDLFKFVRIIRARFQASAIKDISSTTMSSPLAVSVDTTSEGTTNQSHSRSRSKNKDLRAKRGASPRSTASPLTSVSSTRRSPCFVAADAGNRH